MNWKIVKFRIAGAAKTATVVNQNFLFLILIIIASPLVLFNYLIITFAGIFLLYSIKGIGNREYLRILSKT
ncbi:hypothetical protein PMEGAPR185_01940 [Priestia megaterium]